MNPVLCSSTCGFNHFNFVVAFFAKVFKNLLTDFKCLVFPKSRYAQNLCSIFQPYFELWLEVPIKLVGFMKLWTNVVGDASFVNLNRDSVDPLGPTRYINSPSLAKLTLFIYVGCEILPPTVTDKRETHSGMFLQGIP